MKKSKIIVPALGIIAFATAASITGTVAWFTVNNSVSITGMTFTTHVSDGLFIADNLATESKILDTSFKDSLTQTRTAKLEPVSTVNALSFFYSTDALGNGNVDLENAKFYSYNEGTSRPHAVAGKAGYDADFNTRYGVNDTISDSNVLYGYVDYTFYLKANYSSATATYLVMDKCNLLYNGNSAVNEKAWRVALFVHEATAAGTKDGATEYTTAFGDGDRITMLSLSGAQNFGRVTTPEVQEKAISGVTGTTATRGDVTYNTKAQLASNSTTAATKYYKVMARLWLEGEDTTCNVDTFKQLTAAYKLDLNFSLTTVANSGVDAIGSTPVTPAP